MPENVQPINYFILTEAEYCSCIIFVENYSNLEQNLGNISEKKCQNIYIMV